MPYLIETCISRGVSKKDPRRRMYRNNALPKLFTAYVEHYNNANIGEHWIVEEVEKYYQNIENMVLELN